MFTAPAPAERPDPDRVLAGRIGAHVKWANTPDRTAATAAMRAAFDRRFEPNDPDGELTDLQRAQMTESARKAYFLGLAAKSAKARRQRSTVGDLRQLAAEAAAAADAIEADAGDAA
jgi:hypothetical protein